LPRAGCIFLRQLPEFGISQATQKKFSPNFPAKSAARKIVAIAQEYKTPSISYTSSSQHILRVRADTMKLATGRGVKKTSGFPMAL